MPFIQFTILEGRSLEQKERLIHEVSDLTAEILESPIENVRVHIQETSAEHWGIAGKSIKERRNNEILQVDINQDYNRYEIYLSLQCLIVLGELEI